MIPPFVASGSAPSSDVPSLASSEASSSSASSPRPSNFSFLFFSLRSLDSKDASSTFNERTLRAASSSSSSFFFCLASACSLIVAHRCSNTISSASCALRDSSTPFNSASASSLLLAACFTASSRARTFCRIRTSPAVCFCVARLRDEISERKADWDFWASRRAALSELDRSSFSSCSRDNFTLSDERYSSNF